MHALALSHNRACAWGRCLWLPGACLCPCASMMARSGHASWACGHRMRLACPTELAASTAQGLELISSC